MWLYEVASGDLMDAEGELRGNGYSGTPLARNDVRMENEIDVGPIPRGTYTIGEPEDTKAYGPYVMRLTPVSGNMFGRAGFLIHGDSLEHPGAASHGCIILSRPLRELVWTSGDHELEAA